MKAISITALIRMAKAGESFITFASSKDVETMISRNKSLTATTKVIDFIPAAGVNEGKTFTRALLVTVHTPADPAMAKGRKPMTDEEKVAALREKAIKAGKAKIANLQEKLKKLES